MPNCSSQILSWVILPDPPPIVGDTANNQLSIYHPKLIGWFWYDPTWYPSLTKIVTICTGPKAIEFQRATFRILSANACRLWSFRTRKKVDRLLQTWHQHEADLHGENIWLQNGILSHMHTRPLSGVDWQGMEWVHGNQNARNTRVDLLPGNAWTSSMLDQKVP